MSGYVLSARGREALRRFVNGKTLFAWDFDGVLAPIVSDGDRARMASGVRRPLTRLARSHPCVVVSGRKLSDLTPRLHGVPLRSVFGNFGYEPAPRGRPRTGRIGEWAATLSARLGHLQGVVVEDKAFTLSVHYRQALQHDAARRAIDDALSDLPGVRVLEGMLAVALLPARGCDKGKTLQRERRRLGCTNAVYVGDDGTDEDAFASASPERLLAIRVGYSRQTRASFWLESQSEVPDLLRLLLDATSRADA